jgi:bacterioferritin
MRGNDKVIACLNDALKAELTSINQYFLHAEMCDNWGYHGLGKLFKARSFDEMKHAEKLIERILFLEGTPNVGTGLTLKVGSNVKEQLESDLSLELVAFEQYNAAIRVCTEQGDNTSRELFVDLLEDEDKHIDFLEAQLHIIQEAGIENYLIAQTHKTDSGK